MMQYFLGMEPMVSKDTMEATLKPFMLESMGVDGLIWAVFGG